MKKILSMILALALCTACLTACGGDSSGSTSNEETTTTTTTTAKDVEKKDVPIENITEYQAKKLAVNAFKYMYAGQSWGVIPTGKITSKENMELPDGTKYYLYVVQVEAFGGVGKKAGWTRETFRVDSINGNVS